MSLSWKLLRSHVSKPQLVGFFVANLLGMFIVLTGYQVYRDVLPIFTAKDSFLKSEDIVINKAVGTAGMISGREQRFTQAEIDDLAHQPFVQRMGEFCSAAYQIDAQLHIDGSDAMHTELFLESIPDTFMHVSPALWHYTPGSEVVPMILPRSYLTMYNFGFAQSHGLPKISDGVLGMVEIRMKAKGNGKEKMFTGKIVGFSNRFSAIIVPRAFIDWSNEEFAPEADQAPSRLIMSLYHGTDKSLSKYAEKHGYEIADEQLQTEKTTYFLRMMVMIVMGVGVIISVLSFYMLMLSIYLLVQKNAGKLENLLLIGYSPAQVARPYQWMTIWLNAAVLCVALIALHMARFYYCQVLTMLFPGWEDHGMWHTLLLGLSLFMLVSACNMVVIRRKIMQIWRHNI